jgi:hypothetical protein
MDLNTHVTFSESKLAFTAPCFTAFAIMKIGTGSINKNKIETHAGTYDDKMFIVIYFLGEIIE